jgi:predicted porin/uncharacterized membrane-anchored protein YhcB (DUF1043 family)
MRPLTPLHRLAFIVGIIGLGCCALQAQAQDAGKEQQLLRTIELQQTQLEAQQKQLDAQRKMLEAIQSQTQKLLENAQQEVDRLGDVVQQQQQQLESLQRQVSESQPPAEKATVAADVPESFEERPVDKVVTSGGGERVRLAISGHVNRAVQVRDDGKDTDVYHVDNDNSESQVRLVGTAEVDEDLTLGTTIEVSIAPNISGQVDQNNQETDDIFDERKVEVTLDSRRYGKLWLGKGFTASYTAGSVDLSKTTAISYSTIVDTAGSHLFRESDSGNLTNLRIFEAFNAFDGLNRRNRLRYDTPKFGGFHVATSAVSDDRYDASLWWGGRGHGFKAGAAAAVADPNQEDADLQYNGSASILHEDSGLNLSLSFGLLERENQDDQQNYFAKVGWLRRLFSVGDTAFSVDYTRSLNLPTEDDDGYSIAAAAVQQFDKFGAEIYGLYRLHSLDRGVEADVDDITVITLGTRVKF